MKRSESLCLKKKLTKLESNTEHRSLNIFSLNQAVPKTAHNKTMVEMGDEDAIPVPTGNFVEGFGRGRVVRASKGERPEGAIRLTRDEVMKYQDARIRSWEPQSDVWFHKYGFSFSLISASASGYLIMAYLRRKFCLGASHGRIASFAPVMVLPAVGAVMMSDVQRRTLLSVPNCETCVKFSLGYTLTDKQAVEVDVITEKEAHRAAVNILDHLDEDL
ncbi:hypothetical protein MAR_013826 [Mya arenaria]|uniref:Uncharacterized protein n=1 Tax=Mya arenaria TaxID=6604 RepID=A0ABY7G477_MYAAR|nr:hypothetical protein MAR_013826 [Mya arenaria]